MSSQQHQVDNDTIIDGLITIIAVTIKMLFLIINEIFKVFASFSDFEFPPNINDIINTDKTVNIKNYKCSDGTLDRTNYEFLYFTHYRNRTYVLVIIPKHIALSTQTTASLIFNECSMCITVDNIEYSYLNNKMDTSRLYDDYVCANVITHKHSAIRGIFGL